MSSQIPPPTVPSETPLASIVIRSMDRPTLAKALASVAAQTWTAIEVVLVNARGEGHAPAGDKCGPFPMRTVDGAGPLSRSQAANAGIAAARGEWICFLDDDDWFGPRHIETLALRLLREPQAVAAYSGVSCVEVDESGQTREVMQYNFGFDPARLLVENYLPIHAVLFRRAAALDLPGFDEALPIFEDWDFWLQLSRESRFEHVDQISATYRLGSGDSGLYGNTALQEEYAQRILRKWLPAIRPEEWAAMWDKTRRGLRLHDNLRRDVQRLTGDAAVWQREVLTLNQNLQARYLELAQLGQGFANAEREWRTHYQLEIARLDALRAEAVARVEAERVAAIAQLEKALEDERQRALQVEADAAALAQRLEAEASKALAQAEAEIKRSAQAAADALMEAEARVTRNAQAAADALAQAEEAARQSAQAAAALAAAQAARQEAQASELRMSDALQRTMQEYNATATLLRQEQYTVLRPVLRTAKRSVKGVWRQLPAPVQKAVRKALGRPLPPMQIAPPAAVPGTGEDSDWRAALAGGKPGAFTVILFPVIDWHFRIQRPQHLARELGRQGHRVIYVSTTFVDGSGPGDCRLIESPAKNIFLLQLALPHPVPNIYEGALSVEQAQQLADTFAWLQQTADLGPLVSLIDLPFWRPVAARLPANLVVYDCMDYHAGFSNNIGASLSEEQLLLKTCDLLVTTSTRLAEMMRARAPGKPHALVRNGTEVAHFANVPAELKVQRDERPVIGYFGAISEWFDIQLVIDLATIRPQWRFILVGSTYGCDVTQAQKVDNIEFVGEVPYSELPGWVHAFDVCLIPFLINELTSCTNPVKVYEYLSAGKPVVATRMPELEAIADQVQIADDAPGFAKAIELAFEENKNPQAVPARRAWASGHSWEARAEQFSQAVADCLPKVSLIVLCYNNLELTKACVDSVERHSLWPNLELILVDNASSDGTPQWLTGYAKSRPWVKLVLNQKNLGFAAGNNVGLEVATGDYLIMLNNDTEVSPGWIHGLHRHFVSDPGLGMVGPVTDNIGNEAKIEVGYTNKADMPAWATARAIHHAGERIDNRVLAFFCVALRRKVYEQVGGLDEAFGLGFFEDDDYCNRARAAGWRLAIAEDVFVHHHLSASFDKLKSSTRQALFEKNKEIYERKWGPWVPHVYREPKAST
ncbi:MAG: glycosyltransferase [Pseudomonadota bacterium]